MNRKKSLYTFMIAAGSVTGYVALEKYLESDTIKIDLLAALNDDKPQDDGFDFSGTQKILDSLQREKEYLQKEKEYKNEIIRKLNAKKVALEVDLYTSKQYSYAKMDDGISGRGNIRYTHQDKTTTKIIDMLSGFEDANMGLYLDTIEGGDSIMYKTIWQMHTKYKNPKVELVTKFDKETTRADYNAYSNTIRLQADTIFYEGYPFDQEYYIESWIAELAHAYQVRRDGMEIYNERSNKDNSLLTKHNIVYDDLYDIEGTMEYEAHKVIEEKLKKEFVDTYISLSDTNNIEHLYKILRLNTCFFEEYLNEGDRQKYFEKVMEMDGEIKDTILCKHLPWRSLGHAYEDMRKKTKEEKYRKISEYCYLSWLKYEGDEYDYKYYALTCLYLSRGDIDNACKYYALGYPERSKNSVLEDVAIICEMYGRYDEAIQIYENLAKNGSHYAAFCLMKLYDPVCLDEYEKDFPGKDESKSQYREEQYMKLKNYEK